MNISIIGTGAIGGAIAKKLVQAGHKVRVANSGGKEAVTPFAQEIGATPHDVENVMQGADAVILSVPPLAVTKLPKRLFEALPSETIVVDTGNYYPESRPEKIAEVDNGMVESVWVSEQIGRSVIKAFNTLIAPSLINLGKPKGSPNRLAMQVAGDDQKQKQTVMQLVDECGFDPYDSGSLADSWAMQPCSAGYCCDYTASELRRVKAQSTQTKESVAKTRKEVMTNFATLAGGDFSHENIIKINRKYNR